MWSFVKRAGQKCTGGGNADGVVLAPWVDMSAFPSPDLALYASCTGHVVYTLAGISSCLGVPAWAGIVPLDVVAPQVRAMQRLGGGVAVVFGGPNGVDLACELDADSLACQYAAVVDMYAPLIVAFDVFVDDDPAMCRRRAAALAKLQRRRKIDQTMVCVDATPAGVADMAALRLLRDFGAEVDVVCLKAMNFGDAVAPNPVGKTMAWYVCQAALNAQCQLLDAGMTAATVGICFMVGVNDVESEVVTVQDAINIVNFASMAPWVSYVGYWNVNRDKDDGQRRATPVSSGIAQRPFAFLRAAKKCV